MTSFDPAKAAVQNKDSRLEFESDEDLEAARSI
jgi:hypothetical protein